MRRQNTVSYNIFTAGIYIFTIIFTLICLLPFWIIVVNSFAAEENIIRNGYQFIPARFSLYAYTFLLRGSRIFTSYTVTITVTATGTVSAVLISSMFAYVIANKKIKYRNIISFMTYFTMIFGGGMVSTYILIANWLKLKDNIIVLILPYIMNPFFIFILVSFFRTIPDELSEAATIDGANDIYTFFKIIWPVSTPALTSVALLYALQYWNDFWLALMYIDNFKLHPLQMMIRQLMSDLRAAQYMGLSSAGGQQLTPTYGVQLATVVMTIGPIILLYPFLQKYFVSGLMIGSVKG